MSLERAPEDPTGSASNKTPPEVPAPKGEEELEKEEEEEPEATTSAAEAQSGLAPPVACCLPW